MEKFFGHFDFSEDFSLLNSDDTIEVMFYGSIYNKEALKTECGISYDIDNCLLIQKAYELFNTALFKKIDGIFSIAIYDKRSQMLYIVKDRAGIKPIYFYDFNNSIIFGSFLKDFYPISTFTKKIDKNSLAVYLSYGYILQPNSIFEHTHKVKSGHYLAFNLVDKSWEQKAYWTLESCYDEPKLNLKEPEIISRVETILQNSIEKRLDTDTSIAATLSGGYDSSIVTSLLTQIGGKKVDTFTIGFDDKQINEAPYAKKIAAYLGTNHHEHYFTTQDALDIVPKLCEVYDEPFADYGATPTVLVTQMVKQNGFDKLFIGDGGDEVFATADDVSGFDNILKTPSQLRKSLYHVLNTINPLKIPIIKSYQNIPTKYYKFLQLLKADDIPQMVKAKPILFFDNEIKNLLKDDDIEFKTTFDEIDFPEYSESVDQVIGSYFKTSMVDAELVKSFQAARAANIRLKEPLLDCDLIAYMAKVPQSIKIKDGQKKYILKEIAHKYMPKNLLDRPKSGFDIPFSFWLNAPLKELVYDQINERRVKEDGIFDVEAVLNIRDAFYEGKVAYKYKLWTLLLFQLWYQKIKD